MTKKIEFKRVGVRFDDILNKEEEEDYIDYKGIKCKVIKGYIATWDRDRGNDKFHKGAFLDSLKQWRKEKRDPKVKEMHGKTIGVYPLKYLKEDDVGLFGHAYLNMEIMQGREAYSKAKMGIYDRKSIGFSADPDTTKGDFPYGREIYKAHIYEGSLVDEPMNLAARITDVKCIQEFQNLPIADSMTKFDKRIARANVAEFAEAIDEPNENYSKAFVVVGDGTKFSGHQLQIADIVDGEIKIIPRALVRAVCKLRTGKGIEGMSEEQKQEAQVHIEKYYNKLKYTSPWEDTSMLNLILGTEDEIKNLSLRDIEQALKDCGASDSQAKCLISQIKGNDKKKTQQQDTDTKLTELELALKYALK